MKIIELDKVRFIKVNELKLIQVELFSFFPFMCVAANASELFCMAHLENIERFLYHSHQDLKLEAASKVSMASKGRKARRQIYDYI